MSVAMISDVTSAAGGAQTTNSTQLAAVEYMTADISAVTGTSVTLTAQHIQNIKSVVVTARGSGNEIDVSGLDITFSGAVITVADGTGMDISAAVDLLDLVIIGHNN